MIGDGRARNQGGPGLEELEAAVGLRTGRKHVLSILVENKPGVLTRIAGLFARRGFNIDTLTVGPTDDEHGLADHADRRRRPAPDRPGDQAAAQAGQRAEDPRPRAGRRPWRASWRCSRSPPTAPARGEVMQIAEIFRGKVVDVTKRSIIVEVTGTDRQDRGLRAHGAPLRADRDDAHGRDRDLARPRGDIGGAGPDARHAIARCSPRGAARPCRTPPRPPAGAAASSAAPRAAARRLRRGGQLASGGCGGPQRRGARLAPRR